MLPGNILSGAAFRSVILSLGIFILVLLVAGTLLYQLVTSSMYGELENQINEELILFHEIQQRDGQAALTDIVTSMAEIIVSEQQVAGLFDQTGHKMAGNLDVAPDFLGWKTLTIHSLYPKPSGSYHLHAEKLQGTVLVIGRNTRLIDKTQDVLLLALILAGVVVTLTSILVGYTASHRVLLRLEYLAATLDEVSRGDSQVRLEISPSNDQIDHISLQINRHLEQLATLMTNTRNTINAIAHDLRTPVNRAFILLQDITSSQGDQTLTEAHVEAASTELQTVSDIFDTILRISRIETGTERNTLQIFSLHELLADLTETFQPVVEANHQKIVYDPAPDRPLICGDKRMLQQLLVNLIENASCYCPAGTLIHITSRQAQSSTILSVSDNGWGIPAEHRDHVLQPFYRVDTSRSSSGCGLGLALVNAIVTRHRATIRLEDNQPGLRVVITFPPVEASSPGT